jgi:enoyl-CoA hydratase
MEFNTLQVNLTDGVASIAFNRPDKANALSETMWYELRDACQWLDVTPAARVGVLSGLGKHFCAGIDLELLHALQTKVSALAPGHQAEKLETFIRELQGCVSALEQCRKPIIAAIHGACIGGAIDIITACDIRYATADARFSVKEIDLAIVADVGTLQRLPRIVGDGVARELTLTAREFNGTEAAALKLVNQTFTDQSVLMAHAQQIATEISRKSPLAVRGTKATLNFSRDHCVSEGLRYVAGKNASLLMAPDVNEAVTAHLARRPAIFAD